MAGLYQRGCKSRSHCTAAGKAVPKSHENEKRQSQQQEHVHDVTANQGSDKLKYGRLIWQGMHKRSDSDGACRGASCMSVREATKWNTEDPLDGACRGTRKSFSGATKWNTADQSNGACRGVRTSEEEYHAENGAHQLNLLLLNKLSSIFVFVITYHAARQIIERPCHLLSHAVHNSKLTTLPQSKRRWQPSWQRMLEARQIIERLAKDHVTVTLFQNMTWFILGYA